MSNDIQITNGKTISLPLQTIIMLAALLLNSAGVIWIMKSDVRDLKTTMELRNEQYQTQIREMKVKVDTIDAWQRDLSLDLAAGGFIRSNRKED